MVVKIHRVIRAAALEERVNKYLISIAVLVLHSGLIEAYELGPAFYAGISGGLGSTTWSGLVPETVYLPLPMQNALIFFHPPHPWVYWLK